MNSETIDRVVSFMYTHLCVQVKIIKPFQANPSLCYTLIFNITIFYCSQFLLFGNVIYPLHPLPTKHIHFSPYGFRYCGVPKIPYGAKNTVP